MTTRYTVHFQGPDTSITSAPDGPWPRWSMARAAAVEHLEGQVRECKRAVLCLKRAGNFAEYLWLVEEMASGVEDESSVRDFSPLGEKSAS